MMDLANVALKHHSRKWHCMYILGVPCLVLSGLVEVIHSTMAANSLALCVGVTKMDAKNNETDAKNNETKNMF